MNTVRIIVAATALASALPVAAQQRTQPLLGLGVGLPTSDITPLPSPQIYVPINVAPNIRIEPQLGIDTLNDDQDASSTSYWSIGTGAFFVTPVAGNVNVNMYVGPRIVLAFFDDETPTEKSDRTDFFIAGALGGEYVVHPRFSVGAEVQLGYTIFGDTDISVVGLPTQRVQGASTWMTQGLLFVRVYLL